MAPSAGVTTIKQQKLFTRSGAVQATSHGVTPFGKELKDSRDITDSELWASFWRVSAVCFFSAEAMMQPQKHRHVCTTHIQF